MAGDLTEEIKPEPVPSEANHLADKEAGALESGHLKRDAAKRDHGRKQGLRDHLVWGIKFLFWLVLFIVAVMIAIWSYHLLAPSCWHFLSSVQLEKIQTILFSGVTAAAISGVSKKYFLD